MFIVQLILRSELTLRTQVIGAKSINRREIQLKGISSGLPTYNKFNNDSVSSPNDNIYNQMKHDIDADKMIYEIVNKQIMECFSTGSENSTCVSQNKLYKYHPVIKNTMTLGSFCVFLSHCPLIELDQNQVLYKENDTATAFFFILAGVLSLKSK